MEIKKVNLYKLRMHEHFQFETDFKGLVEQYTPDVLKIEALFNNLYLPLYDDEDVVIMKIKKSAYTETRQLVDKARDNSYRGIAQIVRTNKKHFDETISTTAKQLDAVIKTFGEIPKMPLQEKTSAIDNLMEEFEGNYADHVNILGINDWVEQLKTNNDTYSQLVKDTVEEEAGKTQLQLKRVRAEIDEAYRKIIARLEALILIEGESRYTGFVQRLNIILEKLANTLAQRQGIAKAKQNKKEEHAGEDEPETEQTAPLG